MGLRYSVLGAGAMGSVFGARLHLHGFAVELLNRSPAHSNAINAHGLQADIDGKSHRLDIAATTVEGARPADVVILFTKSHQIESALNSMPDSLRNARVITLQNGLGNGQRVAKVIGEERTLEGVSMMPAELHAPGVVASSDPAQTWLYSLSEQSGELAEQIGRDFNQSGITASVTPKVREHIWKKACFNIAMNALCGMTSGSPGLLHQHPDGLALAHELAAEALCVAHALDVAVDAKEVHNLIDYACANHTWHKPSMLQDLENEQTTEIEALNGFIVAEANRLGLSTPLNAMLLRLMRLREQSPSFWQAIP